ncbi:hypothetical protein BH09PSE6_BH09PSE6_05990 [soil metagenome]
MNNRRYYAELGASMMLYASLLLGVNWVDDRFHPTGGARIALALLPMLGCFAALFAILRAVRRMDELQRQIQFEALAFAFAVTALGTFGWGFLEDAGLPHLRAFAVWPVMATAWIVGKLIANRRYQ